MKDQRYKSSPDDDRLIQDENARPLDRAAAMTRLRFDKLYHFEPFFASLLDHAAYVLRGEAIKTLLGMWKRSEYLDAAIQLLRSDPEWETRTDAAFAMTMALGQGVIKGSERERVIEELAQALMRDEDDIAQSRYYELLLEILAPERKGAVPDYFNRERDVDWQLLKPYLDKVPPARQSV
jgi:hypothetical protein